MKPTIVVIAYNRPKALARLLHSLRQAEYPPQVRLVVSIDAGGEQTAAVHRLAAEFNWPHGEKQIIRHEQDLGLIGNVFFGGGLAQEFGSIILLEDDLIVSPMFYRYARQAAEFFAADQRIAGVSLNALWFNGYTHHPFTPYLDETDVFFMQVAWFQGQVYTADQWSRFAAWRDGDKRESAVSLHESFSQFPATDWFPLKTRYLAATNRFYVFPRQSLTTNFGDIGTHFDQATQFFQVPLQTRRQRFRLGSFDESIAVYDSFQEMLPDRLNRLTGLFAGYDYAIDLNGVKSPTNLRADYVLSTRRCRQPLRAFGLALWPPVANVVNDVPGDDVHFGQTADFDSRRLATWRQQKRLHDYYNRGRRLSRKKQLLFWLLDRLKQS